MIPPPAHTCRDNDIGVLHKSLCKLDSSQPHPTGTLNKEYMIDRVSQGLHRVVQSGIDYSDIGLDTDDCSYRDGDVTLVTQQSQGKWMTSQPNSLYTCEWKMIKRG